MTRLREIYPGGIVPPPDSVFYLNLEGVEAWNKLTNASPPLKENAEAVVTGIVTPFAVQLAHVERIGKRSIRTAVFVLPDSDWFTDPATT